jgi:hypothetical protein
LIQFVDTNVYTEAEILTKVLKAFRFNDQLYNDFKKVASAEGYTATGALEHFMSVCVEDGHLLFPEVSEEGFEVEAQVLVDWLSKGRRFYRLKSGIEVNISGRLVELLPKVSDPELRSNMKETLKSSVSKIE